MLVLDGHWRTTEMALDLQHRRSLRPDKPIPKLIVAPIPAIAVCKTWHLPGGWTGLDSAPSRRGGSQERIEYL